MKKNWYLMKNIKSDFIWILMVVVSIVTLSSCSLDPVDKTYNKHTADDDYRRIREISSSIDSADAVLLGKYMIDHGLVGSHVLELHATYRDILDQAKKEKERYEIDRRKKGKNEMDIAKSHENEKIKNIRKVLLVDFVKKDTNLIEEDENTISLKKGKKAITPPPVNKNLIVYEVMFKNVSDKPIKAFKGDLLFFDSFHSEIKKITFTSFEEIPVEGSIVQKFTVNIDEVNKGGTLYNDLKRDVIKVDWIPDRLIHTDDTVIE
jgi:hypothetical protein